jgi:protein TonB
MFQTLLASNVPSRRWWTPALAAAVLHALIIVLAVRVTASMPPQPRPHPDTVQLELRPPTPASENAPERHLLPMPPQSPELPPPLALTGISIDLRISPEAARLKMLKGLIAEGNVGRENGRPEPEGEPIFSPSDVDDPPSMLGDGHPRYPEELRSAGVTGTVRLEYVIRADGTVDSVSVRMLASTHPAFSASAIQFLMQASFKPARRRGVAVPARVRQTIRFEKR